MRPRLLRPALAAVALLLAVPAAAAAAGVALRSPADGIVTGATVLEVRVVTDAQEVAERIEASLRPADGGSEDAVRHLLCDEPDRCSRPDAVYGIEFDPHSGAPFAAESEPATRPNGDYVLRLHLTRPDAVAPETFDLRLLLSAPGRAVTGLTAAIDGGEVTLSWDTAPEPDLSGYLLERLGSDGWVTLAELPAEATTSTDRPPPGHQAYRVVTLRPDGRGATYETVSREVTVEVADPADPPVGGDGAGPGDDDGRDDAGVGRDDAGDDSATERTDRGTAGGAADPPATSTDEATGSGSAPASETPSPGTSSTDRDDGRGRPVEAADRFRTVTEEGELVAADAGSAAGATEPARYVLPTIAGVLFVALGVRTWRWSRRVAPPR